MSLDLPTIPHSSSEFRKAEYLLQESLGSPNIFVKECYDLASLSNSSRFAVYCSGLQPRNIVHMFIPVSDLSQPLSDLAAHGIRVPTRRGLKFRVGKTTIKEIKETIDIVHCIVALGSVLNYQSDDSIEKQEFCREPPTSEFLPTGFNTLCVSSDGEFVIFEQEQIRSLHILRFNPGNDLVKHQQTPLICDLCHKNQSSVWCSQCSAQLCEACDASSHSSNSLLERHVRSPVSQSRHLMECCPIHPSKRIEYLCEECKVPICIECKMTGSHSVGQFTQHQLIPVKDAYLSSIKKSSAEDPILKSRKRALRLRLEEANSRMKEIVTNELTAEAEIMRIANEAIQSLKKQAEDRAIIVRSVQTELQRKLNECDAKIAFLKDQRDLMNPVEFVNAEQCYTELLAEMKTEEDFPLPLEVHGDLVVGGSIQVTGPHPLKRSKKKKEEYRLRDEPTTGTEEVATTTTSTTTTVVSEERKSIKVITLTKMAERRRSKLNQLDVAFPLFEGSSVISNEDDGLKLYLCFPFKPPMPRTHLLFSSIRDGRSIKIMHEKIDGVGITVVLIRKGKRIFGGFAAAKWNRNGDPVPGNSSSFLFSVSNDVFIPYKPRAQGACSIWANDGSVTFGRYDLVLSRDFSECFCDLEHSYGVGLEPGSREAVELLAGADRFTPDVVEVWGFFTPENLH